MGSKSSGIFLMVIGLLTWLIPKDFLTKNVLGCKIWTSFQYANFIKNEIINFIRLVFTTDGLFLLKS